MGSRSDLRSPPQDITRPTQRDLQYLVSVKFSFILTILAFSPVASIMKTPEPLAFCEGFSLKLHWKSAPGVIIIEATGETTKPIPYVDDPVFLVKILRGPGWETELLNGTAKGPYILCDDTPI